MVGMILLMSFYVVFTAILFSVHISMAARNITTNEVLSRISALTAVVNLVLDAIASGRRR
eukprot:SAG31_NODE_1571_length_7851_cov_8.714525_4_plen_60_part_00